MTVLEYALSTAWALEPVTLQKMLGILVRHASGQKLAEAEVEAVLTAARAGKNIRDGEYDVTDSGDAVIPIRGVIAKHASQVSGISGPRGTSTRAVEADIERALADKDVRRIILDIESPGGAIDGVAELADAVYAARAQKPVIAYANDLMASAAYWIGAQANEVYATPGALVGSIGVYSVIEDLSRYAQNLGIDVEVIRSAPLKGGAAGAPVLPEQREVIQEIVDGAHLRFVEAVARGRNVTETRADEWATGRVWSADKALELGLIDGIKSFSETLTSTHGGRRSQLAVSEEVSMTETRQEPAPSPEDMRAQDRQRLADLKSAFPDDLAFAVAQWEAGHNLTEAKASYSDVLSQRLAESEKAREAAEKKAATPAEPKPVGVAALRSGPSMPAPASDFLARVKELEREGHAPDRALSLAVGEDPERHIAFLASAPRNRGAMARFQLAMVAEGEGVRGED